MATSTKQPAIPKLDPRTDGQSLDLLAENVAALKALFPEIVTDGKVDFDALRTILGDEVDAGDERYGLNWHGKAKARRIAQTSSTGTLRPCPEESVDWDTTQNLFIEGDNLEVLKLLQKPYHRQVKMIYIDPPYNTGNEFIYPDKFQDNLDTYLQYTGQKDGEGFKTSANAETGGRYHTNWLNMMYPRLRLARNLLRDDGVIFVSIDDHEVQNLRALMDELFGPENFVATAVWEKADSPRNSARQFSEDHDYILVYSRDPSWVPNRLPRTEEANSIYANPDDDPRGDWIPGDPFANKPYSKGLYTVSGPTGRQFSPPPGRFWRISEEKLREMDSEGRIWWGPNRDARPSIKRYLSEVANLTPRTLWRKEQVGSNRTSKNELRALFPGSDTFDTPKPIGLVERMLQLATTTDEADIVLDFFGGSGTTAHATLKMNVEDGGNRRFVLVQLPEPLEAGEFKTIADFCRDRIRRACDSLMRETPILQHPLGFRSLKLDSSNIKTWEPASSDLEPSLLDAIDNIKAGRTEADLVFEILLKYGLDLTTPITTRDILGKAVHIVGGGALVVCLAPGLTLPVVEAIAGLYGELYPGAAPGEYLMRVVFRDACFADDVVKTNAVQILRRAGIADIKSL
jgi:adenine-specific DNA-methyltransferase